MTFVNADTTYFQMVDAILENSGVENLDRTGTGTISTIGHKAAYRVDSRYSNGDLHVENFPLLTTKKISFKNIFSELLWFINGHTNIEWLEQQNNHIWVDWRLKPYNKKILEDNFDGEDRQMSREEFYTKIATDKEFARQWGDLGPVYGSQWRAWQTLESMEYGGEPIDQFKLLLDSITKTPYSRRQIVSAWNPAEMDEIVAHGLPPCHTLWQVIVKEGKVNLLMYQRSLDVMLGAPYNIASYSLLLALIAEYAGLETGEFIHMVGDCHIYLNHLDQIAEQRTRTILPSPKIVIEKGTLRELMDLPLKSNIDYEYFASKVRLVDYESHAAIKAPVAV